MHGPLIRLSDGDPMLCVAVSPLLPWHGECRRQGKHLRRSSRLSISGKFISAWQRPNLHDKASYVRVASCGESNVPSHTRIPVTLDLVRETRLLAEEVGRVEVVRRHPDSHRG
jgi:hypothetical protein